MQAAARSASLLTLRLDGMLLDSKTRELLAQLHIQRYRFTRISLHLRLLLYVYA